MTLYDVAILSDLRCPDGTTASIVAEVRAQAAAGLSTVLVHVPSPHLRHSRPFQPRIVACLREGLAALAHDDDTEITAGVLLLRQPRIFAAPPAGVPRIRAGHTVVVLDRAPGDERDHRGHYDLDEVRRRVDEHFGAGAGYAPVSAEVREAVLRAAPRTPLPATDWHEIVDVADWVVPHRRPGAIPVIGRYGRPDPAAWPRDPGEMLQAYPDTGEVRVRILGGGEIGVRRLGRLPKSWDVVEFGAQSPRDFLAGLDFFVYFHDTGLREPFGRTLLEAMAAGVPVVVGPHFRKIFGDAAVYTDPAGVLDAVRRLHGDRDAYEAQVARAREFVTTHYGTASHLARLASLGVIRRQPEARGTRPPSSPDSRRPGGHGADDDHRTRNDRASAFGPAAANAGRGFPRPAPGGPTGSPPPARGAEPPRGRRPVRIRPQPRRVLFVGDDVDRFRAIARRLPSGLEAVVVAGSGGLGAAHAAGLLTEYLPGAAELGVSAARWTAFVSDRLRHLVELYGPRAVLVGGLPHDGIVEAAAGGGPRWLWLRPAMWKRGTGGEWTTRGAAFDGILEPGEFAAAGDEGWTTTARSGVTRVAPITDLPVTPPRRTQEKTLLCRGIDAALPGFRPIGFPYASAAGLGGVGAAVSRADYTGFHELIGARVPTVFVPDRDADDDELARARFAAAAGVALCATTPQALGTALEQLASPRVREALTRRCAAQPFENGAADAADWIAGHCREPDGAAR